VIKQFNFYDIYGYLLPGIALLGLAWMPLGVVFKKWPEQDVSTAVFFVVLAYLLGHILQTIATLAIPSKVMRDDENRQRFPSDRLLDAGMQFLGRDFKTKLAEQVRAKFNLDLHTDSDGDGTGEIFFDRNTAFFLARSFLIAQKTAHYVEQFEGLYALMRGLFCAFLAGSCYLAGWAMAFYRGSAFLGFLFATFGIIGVVVTLVCSFVGLSRNSTVLARAMATLGIALLVAVFCAGFWAGAWQPAAFWTTASDRVEFLFWLLACISLIAALRCFSSYRSFAIQFAQSVWRDFSVHISVQDSQGASGGGDDGNEDS